MPSILLCLALLFSIGTATAQVDWQLLANANAPAPSCGFAFDASRSVLVAHGGEINGVAQWAVREWNGSAWVTKTPGNPSLAMGRTAMAFDAARGDVLLFGGFTGSALLDRTLTWDGTSWNQLNPQTVPPVRSGAAMAYDPTREVVVMFGGFGLNQTDRGDTWEWDGTNWSLQTTTTAPSPRGAHRMVYDHGLGEVLLCGGYETANQRTVADCWSWNGTVWTPQASLPTTLCDEALVYDPTRQLVVLFGGLRIQGGVLTNLGTLYEFDGSWSVRSATGGGPTARSGCAAAFDPVANRAIVAGGITASGTSPQTWSHGPTQPADAAEFGTGCTTTAGARLELRSLPYVGRPFVQDIVDASPAAAIGAVVFGVSNTSWTGVPLPFDLGAIGAPGCSLLVSLDVPLSTLLSNGTGCVTWQLPNAAAAIGFQMFTQGVVFDPSSPLAFQVDMTSGWQVTVGSP